jgi:hypothetical protein
MLPHYISHEKKQMGKLWDSRRDARRCGCIRKGQGKKQARPREVRVSTSSRKEGRDNEVKGKRSKTSGEKGKKNRIKRRHLDLRIVQATKYLLKEKTGHRVVVERKGVIHHPECGDLRLEKEFSLSKLGSLKWEGEGMQIMRSERYGEVKAVPLDGLAGMLERVKEGGIRAYPRCKCRSMMQRYILQDVEGKGGDGMTKGLGEEFCKEMERIDRPIAEDVNVSSFSSPSDPFNVKPSSPASMSSLAVVVQGAFYEVLNRRGEVQPRMEMNGLPSAPSASMTSLAGVVQGAFDEVPNQGGGNTTNNGDEWTA